MSSGTTIILFLVSIVIIGILLIVIITFSRKAPKSINVQEFQEAWLAIENSVSEDVTSQYMAILNADKLLDKALRISRFKGETMGERMTSASRVFTRREAAWAAHKFRNRIAHEESVKININLTNKVLISFKKALKDLGAL
ncbi:hypothetical protein EOL73_00410 [Candidatus Saccharibacteria bacterium]|nr:hypothetical protein [Candidatus Saccharibacteria bacterium]NCU40204.1 hypothetical protein [Candidatus Saccharibacteria bacterium]